MSPSENERLKVRVKAGARIMSTGWFGICRVWFGDEIMEKRGPRRLTCDEAEADAAELLEEFHKMMMEQPTARFLGAKNAQKGLEQDEEGTAIDEPI
jgi:hypothetical protein